MSEMKHDTDNERAYDIADVYRQGCRKAAILALVSSVATVGGTRPEDVTQGLQVVSVVWSQVGELAAKCLIDVATPFSDDTSCSDSWEDARYSIGESYKQAQQLPTGAELGNDIPGGRQGSPTDMSRLYSPWNPGDVSART